MTDFLNTELKLFTDAVTTVDLECIIRVRPPPSAGNPPPITAAVPAETQTQTQTTATEPAA